MKKVLLALMVVAMLICALAISVSAAEPDTTKESVTLSDGTVCPIWDTDGDALIWYVSGTNADGKNAYSYVKATSSEVDYNSGWSGTSYGVSVIQVSSVTIKVDGVSYDKSKFVVLNLKDDIKVTSNKNIGQPINCLAKTFTSATNLEYVYLPLNFAAFNGETFKSCSKLKYVNIEELTELCGVGSQDFNTGSGLFSGKVLDLSKTKINTLSNGAFTSLGATGVILPSTLTSVGSWAFQNWKNLVEIRFPEAVTIINDTQFNGSSSLKTIYINNTTTSISATAFKGTALETVFYVGTLAQLNALLDNTSTSSNDPFWAVVGENRANLISYESYKNLNDKSGKYVVYDYSYCEAYNNGNHSFDPEKSNGCAGICGVCGEAKLKDNPVHSYVTTINYANGYTRVGIKTQTCQNAGCAHENGYDTDVDAVVDFRGISVKESGDGLTFGFTINYKALDELVKITGKEVELGFVVGVKDFIEGEAYNNKNAVTASVLTWIVETEEEKNEVKYASADFVLRGTWDKMVDLDGDETAETDVKDVEFYMAGYLATNNTVSYLNASDNFTTPDVVTYNGCNQ